MAAKANPGTWQHVTGLFRCGQGACYSQQVAHKYRKDQRQELENAPLVFIPARCVFTEILK